MLWVEPYEPGLSIDLPKLGFVNGSVVLDGVINAYVMTMGFKTLHFQISATQVLISCW
jgi:hypothetical protein